MNAYITAAGAYLPGDPVGNDEIAARLGGVDPRGDRLRRRVLAANGIVGRHYAIDAKGRTTELNEELAAAAVGAALADRGASAADLDMLATATTQGDLLVPGFASMVHGRVGGGPMQLLSAAGVCASSLAALDAAVAKVRLGDRRRAAVVGSELSSRWLRGSRFNGSGGDGDAHFLRWMLSDGAGAVLVEDRPRADRPSLRVDWVRTVSLAHEHAVCMRAGMDDGAAPQAGRTWQDLGGAAAAEQAGMMLLRQDTSALGDLAEAGLREFQSLTREGLVDLKRLDHVLCHYSTNAFRDIVFERLGEASGGALDTDRWFSNLETKGNTGAASIFIALEECWRTGRFEPGQTVLLAVPESGRFTFGFAHLTCVDAEEAEAPVRYTPAPRRAVATDSGDVNARLEAVWGDFEERLDEVPVMRRLAEGTVTIEDYRRLLFNLRQQVADGARWISRAASNFSVDLFDLRSAAIGHAAEEHRDFMLLERNYAACGGSMEDIRAGEKNIGSEALSAYMFHTASQPDPVGLLGAMFIIEGLGTGKAAGWAARFREVLGLADDQVSFLAYHGEADDDHFANLQAILAQPWIDAAAADAIVKTAKVVARLYALQLEELDNV
ncbi:3-oxoacyl-[acyl-carrier-protein] synthase III C-terminal domain-containing protein [Glycomyces paridis]|uniref:Beta-ketoacyl-[acyl-carrier-protein] synthase III C-terminal domain-containing protein n=1 Tax=Glycomyces paridis TaxID=2126555 RepID=A0A4S8PA81_9ACTN|nr:3-oxoacyl-[acyl-carrier-protein] synthase III C-terminal domain-containing protein [Glycomyces paridis]THV26042.1 hypothetical protein E9998_20145 [Glycomyces paridis]